MARTATGDMIVNWYMDLADNRNLPAEVRDAARSMLRDFAIREPHQTVEDILGVPN